MAVVASCSLQSSHSTSLARPPSTSPFFYAPPLLASSVKRDVEAILYANMLKISKHYSEAKDLLKSEKLSFLLYPTKRSRRPQVQFEMNGILSASQMLCSGLNDTKITKWAGNPDTDPKQPFDNYVTVKHMLTHEKLQPFRYSVPAFAIANGLMLSLPFEALAETCQADSSVFNMPLLLAVALIGATVGGLLARQRRGELTRLNDQLRQINAALRRQAKIESYAPTLSYAPVGSRIPEDEVIVDPRKEELISRLKTGKNFLRNQDPTRAFEEFKASLEIARKLKDPTEEKKAARGLGASLQRQGKYREAIKYHSMVLEISEQVREDSGNTEAYGAIADCYTELGDLERAAEYYDKYIARLEKD